jgi:predicted amidophosphoribosyltransferase
MSDGIGTKCLRCQQALSAENGFCTACGLNNTDIEEKKYGLLQKSQRRIDRARLLSKFYRLMWFGGFFR